MVTVRTDLADLKESGRRQRFEPTGNVTATSVQEAIQQVDAEAAGKIGQVGTARLPAYAATLAILTTDIEVGVNTATGAVAADLPSVAAWAAENPNGLELSIFDFSGDAPSNNVTFSLNGSDSFVQAIAPVITTAYGGVKLRPVIGASNQWYVRAEG